MAVCVEYVEEGMLFTGQYLAWNADESAIQAAARTIAPKARCNAATIEAILRFELKQREGI